jgi:hypothetical protein
MVERRSGKHWWNDTYRIKLEYSWKTHPNATLSTTHLTLTDLGLNPGLHSETAVTNQLVNNKQYIICNKKSSHCKGMWSEDHKRLMQDTLHNTVSFPQLFYRLWYKICKHCSQMACTHNSYIWKKINLSVSMNYKKQYSITSTAYYKKSVMSF